MLAKSFTFSAQLGFLTTLLSLVACGGSANGAINYAPTTYATTNGHYAPQMRYVPQAQQTVSRDQYSSQTAHYTPTTNRPQTTPVANTRSRQEGGKIQTYFWPASRENLQTRASVKQAFGGGGFETIVARLVRLPHDVALNFRDCDGNAYYDPNERSLNVCYSFLQYIVDQGDEDVTTGAITFLLMHELGHALVDILDLPIAGREEDAADQFASLLLLSWGEEQGARALIGAAFFFAQLHKANGSNNYWDEHSSHAQRYFSLLCLTFGRDPEKYMGLVENEFLPRRRALRCVDEYQSARKAWNNILESNSQFPNGVSFPF